MTTPFDFGELRSLLQQPPSPQVWDALCTLVFPAKWERHADLWLPYAQELLDRCWPDHLRLLPIQCAERKRLPSLARLARHLTLAHNTPRQLTHILAMLAAHPLPLTQLTMRGGRGLSEAEAQTLWDALGSLEVATFESVILDEPMAHQLAHHPHTARLTALRLSRAWMADPALCAILRSPHLARLRALRLRWRSNTLNAALGEALAASAFTAGLTALDLGQTTLHGDTLRQIARVPWPALRALDLEAAQPPPDALRLMLAAAPNVHDLNLCGHSACEPLIEALCEVETLRLEALELSFGRASSAAFARLLTAPQTSALTRFTARDVALGAAGAEALLLGDAAQRLEALSMQGEEQGEAFWRALGAARLPRLTSLSLAGARLGALELDALCAAQMPALTTLDLNRATLPDDAPARLARASWRPQLSALITR